MSPRHTGYDGRSLTSITRGGPPFNRPTNLAVAPGGDLYVSDGYSNARIHRFNAAGQLIQSWGEPGNGAGQFNLPHGLAVLADGRVVVADRENDRLQFFSPDGEYLDEWTDVQRPTNVALDGDGRLYVSELWRRVGDLSFRLGDTTDDRPGRVSVYDAGGAVLARWGGPDRCAPGNFCAPHDICVDAHGDIMSAKSPRPSVSDPAWCRPIATPCRSSRGERKNRREHRDHRGRTEITAERAETAENESEVSLLHRSLSFLSAVLRARRLFPFLRSFAELTASTNTIYSLSRHKDHVLAGVAGAAMGRWGRQACGKVQANQDEIRRDQRRLPRGRDAAVRPCRCRCSWCSPSGQCWPTGCACAVAVRWSLL